MTIMTTYYPPFTPEEIEAAKESEIAAKKVFEAYKRRFDPAPSLKDKTAEPDPIADMQRLWLKYLETDNVRWCHAVTARAALFNLERLARHPPVQTLRKDFAVKPEAAE